MIFIIEIEILDNNKLIFLVSCGGLENLSSQQKTASTKLKSKCSHKNYLRSHEYRNETADEERKNRNRWERKNTVSNQSFPHSPAAIISTTAVRRLDFVQHAWIPINITVLVGIRMCVSVFVCVSVRVC